MSDKKQAIKSLQKVYKVTKAAEQGYEVVAENVPTPGLKVLLKSFAQQRADFATALSDEIERLGGKANGRGSVLGMIHRGRIDIFATLTIGPQNVTRTVLSEALRGERVSLRSYKKALQKPLPAQSKQVLTEQLTQVKAVCTQLESLKGSPDEQLMVQLFESNQDAVTAVDALESAGFDQNHIETRKLAQDDIYEGRRNTVRESTLSGAVGGAIWGSALSLLACAGHLIINGLNQPLTTLSLDNPLFILLLGLVIGALFGALFGLVIGVAIAGEDRHVYGESMRNGRTLIFLNSPPQRVDEAARILQQAAV